MANKTQKIFDEVVFKMAEVVKLVNEDMEDPDTEMYKVDNLNDEIFLFVSFSKAKFLY